MTIMPTIKTADSNCNRGSLLSCFLTGLGTGAALTFLLAPRSGVATRQLIGRSVEDSTNWMKDEVAAAKNCVVTHAAGIRDGVNEAAEVLGRS